MKRRTIILIVLFAIVTTEGFVAAPLAASNIQYDAAISFEVPANKSHIYVIRLYRIAGSAGSFSVHLNRTHVTELGIGTFTLLEVSPGDHEVYVLAFANHFPRRKPQAVRLSCLPGNSYFFLTWIEVNFKYKSNFRALSEEEGKEYVHKYQMVQSSNVPTDH